MQLFPCPFCGKRDETEFSFAGESGKLRPAIGDEISAQDWSRFLNQNGNPRGRTSEIWVHRTCGDFFLLERDATSHEVLSSHSLRMDG